MADYNVRNPTYCSAVRMLEPTDRAHADIFNLIIQQLLENDEVLKNNMDNLKEITAEEILSMYDGDIDIGDTKIGITPGEIDDMYDNDVINSTDTGIPDYLIDEMYDN